MKLNFDLLAKVDTLACSNPFSPRWIEQERDLLGQHFIDEGESWHLGMSNRLQVRQNIAQILEWSGSLEKQLHSYNLSSLSPQQQSAAENLVLFNIFHELEPEFLSLSQALDSATFQYETQQLWRQFLARLQASPLAPLAQAPQLQASHIFAIFFQMRRAFDIILKHISGSSRPSALLRSQIWESIFTHQLQRYREGLYRIMADIPTLISGPTGSGKELVAKAIGLSRYIPFLPDKAMFSENLTGGLITLNLTALNPTLVESELFGHAKGSFTGAHGEHKGWLEQCTPFGSVFLDEIGDVSLELQVKLLRVLQNRSFCRVGENRERQFHGKILAATHKNLLAEIEKGAFRHDFYYRLCADVIHVPSLKEILSDKPSDLYNILLAMTQKMLGDLEAAPIAKECELYITKNLGFEFPWTGNFRELEQFLRRFLVHGHNDIETTTSKGNSNALWEKFEACELKLDELNGAYLKQCYDKWQSYEKVSKNVNCDRRTVKSKIEQYITI
jgi:transcriptional regulator with AAA-type ATPase domain